MAAPAPVDNVAAVTQLYRDLMIHVCELSVADLNEHGVENVNNFLTLLLSRTEAKLQERGVVVKEEYVEEEGGEYTAGVDVNGDTPMHETESAQPDATPYNGGIPPSPFHAIPPSPFYAIPPSPWGGVPPSPSNPVSQSPLPAAGTSPANSGGSTMAMYGSMAGRMKREPGGVEESPLYMMPPSPVHNGVPQNDGQSDTPGRARAATPELAGEADADAEQESSRVAAEESGPQSVGAHERGGGGPSSEGGEEQEQEQERSGGQSRKRKAVSEEERERADSAVAHKLKYPKREGIELIFQCDGGGSDDDEFEKFTPVAIKADPGGANDEELNSDDDCVDSDDDDEEDGETENIVLALFEKVTKNKNHTWKANLKDGIMFINGKDYPFTKASAELKLFGDTKDENDSKRLHF